MSYFLHVYHNWKWNLTLAVKVFLSFKTKCIYCCKNKNEGPSRKGLFLLVDLITSAIALIDCFFAFRLLVRWPLIFCSKSAWSCFSRNAAFSLSIEATCDEEVPVTTNNTFNLLSYVTVLLHRPINNTVFSKKSSAVLIFTVMELSLPEFNC